MHRPADDDGEAPPRNRLPTPSGIVIGCLCLVGRAVGGSRATPAEKATVKEDGDGGERDQRAEHACGERFGRAGVRQPQPRTAAQERREEQREQKARVPRRVGRADGG